ncbi:MAG: acyl-ACP--UDP-N-acetylglucosamine O-acyltransferase [Planctomycetes bacterium]|nr:acyl-ACP--UDP-N-acetylglucosamine O-acyltransferase [Planctomycetota bacterium]
MHPSAVVPATASLGENVRVGAFAVIGDGVVIGAGSEIGAHAIVRDFCVIGERVLVDSFAVVGGRPQTRGQVAPGGIVRIGDDSVVREGVTVSLPTKADSETVVGKGCLLMANSHVGHDTLVGDAVTLANNVMLAGHVQIGDSVFLGGGAGVHQFVRIGRGAIVGGNASISYDVAPFVIAAERNRVCGLNVVGLRRQGITGAVLADLKRCYHAVFRGGCVREHAAAALRDGAIGTEAPGRAFLTFFAEGRRGFAITRSRRENAAQP